LLLVEPEPAILALREGLDLFGNAWSSPLARIVQEDAGAFLRRTSGELDAILDQGDALATARSLEEAKRRLAKGAALVRIARAGPSFAGEAWEFVRAFPDSTAFR